MLHQALCIISWHILIMRTALLKLVKEYHVRHMSKKISKEEADLWRLKFTHSIQSIQIINCHESVYLASLTLVQALFGVHPFLDHCLHPLRPSCPRPSSPRPSRPQPSPLQSSPSPPRCHPRLLVVLKKSQFTINVSSP